MEIKISILVIIKIKKINTEEITKSLNKLHKKIIFLANLLKIIINL